MPSAARDGPDRRSAQQALLTAFPPGAGLVRCLTRGQYRQGVWRWGNEVKP